MSKHWLSFTLVWLSCVGLDVSNRGFQVGADEPAPAKSWLGINMDGPADWNTEHPFVDVFHLSREWISQRKGEGWGKGPKLERDEHGWIKRLETDCSAETPILTHGHASSGDYVCLYEGEGEIKFGHNAKVTSREPGRLVVHIEPRDSGTFL